MAHRPLGAVGPGVTDPRPPVFGMLASTMLRILSTESRRQRAESTANSCVRLIPGSQKQTIPHVACGEQMEFQEMADPSHVDDSKAVNMELKPGEFFLFNEKTLHQSHAHRSDKRRIGLAVRVTVPFVKVYHEKLFRGHKVIVISGEDRMGINQSQPPPAS